LVGLLCASSVNACSLGSTARRWMVMSGGGVRDGDWGNQAKIAHRVSWPCVLKIIIIKNINNHIRLSRQ